MTGIVSAREYVERLKAAVFRSPSIAQEDRIAVPCKFDEKRKTWIVIRGFDAPEQLFGKDAAISSPFELICGGRMSLHVRILR